jgi:putative nucleotidyltransferase with HDIG domain
VVAYVPERTILQPFLLFLRGWVLISLATVLTLLLLTLLFIDRLLLPIERLLRLTRGSRVMNTEAAASDDLLVLTRSVNRLMAYIEAFPGVLNLMLGLKDGYTSHHTREVARYAVDIGNALGFSERQLGELECAALLHDIGKAGVPDVVLKKPGALTDEEWLFIRLHPVIGAEVAAEAGFSTVITHAIRQHHERLDGSGYPDRLVGEGISLYARIIAVADTYHAMTSNRPYRPSRGSAVAQTELCEGAGSKYDFRVVQAFLAVLAQGAGNGGGERTEQAEQEESISTPSPA